MPSQRYLNQLWSFPPQGEVNQGKLPEGHGEFSYRGDDDHGRMSYKGDWKNKAAHGYGVMRWQNGDRSAFHCRKKAI